MKVWMLIAAVIFGGCASLSKEECRNADWNMIGFEDGSAGKTLDTIGRHRQACAKVNVTPSLAEYERGHKKIVPHYCTVVNGFDLRERGLYYNGVCSGSAEEEFLQAYQHGKAFFDLHKTIDKQVGALETLTEHLDQVEAAILEHEASLVRGDQDHQSRRTLVRALRELHEEKTQLLDDRKQIEYDVEVMHTEVDRLVRKQRVMGYR